MVSSVSLSTVAAHVWPELRTTAAVVALFSIAGAHVKYYLATTKSGPRALDLALQQEALAVVSGMLDDVEFPAAVVRTGVCGGGTIGAPPTQPNQPNPSHPTRPSASNPTT